MEQQPPSITPSDMSCHNCGFDLTGTAVGGSCPECGTPVEESMRHYMTRKGPISDLPEADFVGPILVTVLCCLPAGIVAIVYTSKANTARASGDVAGYEDAMSKRKLWTTLSIVGALLWIVLQIGLIAVAQM